MAPYSDHRWRAVCMSIFLGASSMSAAAMEAASIKAQLTLGEEAHVLKHVLAWQPPEQTEELWIYLTDAELPLATARDPAKVKELVGQGRLRGVKLVINSAKPDPEKLNGTLFLPVASGYQDMPAFWDSAGNAGWERLVLVDKRVLGSLIVSAGAGLFSSGSRKFADTPAWSLEAEFSAPIVAAAGGEASTSTQTLAGVQAQKSPQAEVFLAYEKALLWQGIDAASPYMTAEKLVDMRGTIEQFGADGFREFQARGRESTPQGETRRRQIEKLVLDGDRAVLEVRSQPGAVDVVPLVKMKDGWKIGK